MPYTVDGLEKSRIQGFRPRNVFGLVLKEFLRLEDGLKILDLGCGTGFFIRILAAQCRTDITGLDINEELLRGAQSIAFKNNLDIKFEKGDITNLPYDNQTFDLVMCDIMLECFPDKTIPLKEMKRVCRKGGTIAAIEPFYQSNLEYYPGTDNETRDLLIKFSRADRAFGMGPMLPELFNKVGLDCIDLIGWFWGKVGYSRLECETAAEWLMDMEENINRIKRFLPRSAKFTNNEKEKIIRFYEQRYEYYKQKPGELKNDMSITGLPVFIVKGIK